MILHDFHGLFHVLEELVCPEDPATQWWHVIAYRRILILLLIELDIKRKGIKIHITSFKIDIPFVLYQFHLKTSQESHNTCGILVPPDTSNLSIQI